mgnify:CR=1 FL=1
MNSKNRRNFIKGGIALSAVGLLKASNHEISPTPKETKGPFYPIIAQKDKDFDLTKVEGRKEEAKGQKIIIEGQVLDTSGKPLENVTVDLWQANAAGRYHHPHDDNEAPVDPNFQGWAIVQSGKEGKFRFVTVIPGAYKITETWSRPPHIHFKVTKRGYQELITQMYFPGNKLNTQDGILQNKSKAEIKLMIATKANDKPETYSYKIVLEKV